MRNVDLNTPKARPGRTMVAVVALAMLVVTGCSTSGSDEAEQAPDSKVVTTAMGPDDTTPSTVGVDTTEAPDTTTSAPDETPTTVDLGSENPDEAGTPYPAQVQTNFTTSCVANGGEESDCRCLLDELTAQLSLNDFIALEAEMTESGETPEILNEAVQTCAG